MRPNNKTRDRLVNVIILALTLTLAATLAKEYFYPNAPGNRSLSLVGSRLAVPGVDWHGAERTLLIVIDEECPYSEQSVPFYWQLAELAAGRSDVRLLAVTETDEREGRRYLEANGVRVEVARWLFRKSGVFQTPNLILANRQGEVTNQWGGLLSSAGQAEVIRRLLGEAAAARAEALQSPVELQGGVYGIAARELPQLMKEQRVTLVDLDEREKYAAEHIAGAKNIPTDELYVRALNELDKGATVVLYTRNYNRFVLGNVQMLRRQGFESVRVLKGGLDGWKGEGLPAGAGPGAKETARR